jgi:hypothetical protein
LKVAASDPLLLYAARLVPQKQPKVFAKTMQRLHEQGVAFSAVVAGDGPGFEWLREFVNDNGLAGQVKLLGAIPPEQVRRLMAAADIFFLPSAWEGIALSIYEAMAAGLPVVGADVGGQCELVTPECGVLLPRTDESAEVKRYAAVLVELLGDPQRRQALGAAGRQRVEAHFRLDDMGRRMQACLARARALHAEQPRLTPDLALGRLCAQEAVEYARLWQLAEQLWAERHGQPSTAAEHPWRQRLYQRLYKWHEPYYRWYSKKGLHWLAPLRDAITRTLLQSASRT